MSHAGERFIPARLVILVLMDETDLNILIRTMLHVNGTYYFNVGGGIVADSDPEMEYEETLHKGKGIMQALGITDNR